LQGPEKVLVFGSSTGASSAMDHLIDEFKRRHQEIARHIVGFIVLDEQELTEDHLLARAGEFYARAAC
jgi:hypothetical protein